MGKIEVSLIKGKELTPNNRLQRTLKGRGETLSVNVGFSGRAPSKPLKLIVSSL